MEHVFCKQSSPVEIWRSDTGLLLIGKTNCMPEIHQRELGVIVKKIETLEKGFVELKQMVLTLQKKAGVEPQQQTSVDTPTSIPRTNLDAKHGVKLDRGRGRR
jgi:hypothetical protein